MADWSLLTYRKRLATNRVILHASHTPPSQSNLEAFLRVEGRRRGLLDVGYHFVIPRDGPPVCTRPHDAMGSHCPGHNWDSIGVCLGGGVTETSPEGFEDILEAEDNFTPAQGDHLRSLMRYLTECYGRLPLVGHSELPRHKHRVTQCPPTDMEEVRRWVSS